MLEDIKHIIFIMRQETRELCIYRKHHFAFSLILQLIILLGYRSSEMYDLCYVIVLLNERV